jgi:hypothetical protein
MAYFPALGDPYTLPLHQFDAYLDQIEEIESWKKGESDPMERLTKRLDRLAERRRRRA